MTPQALTFRKLGDASPSFLFFAQTVLCAGGILIALFAFLGAVPPLRFGFWTHNSGALTVLRIGGAVAALGLALCFLGRPRATVRLPLSALGLALLGALALGLALIAHDATRMSMLGSPVFGDGPVWWLCAAALAAAAGRLMLTRVGRLFLAAAAFIAVVIEFTLHLAPIVPAHMAPYSNHYIMHWTMIGAAAIMLAVSRDRPIGILLFLVFAFGFFTLYFFSFPRIVRGLFLLYVASVIFYSAIIFAPSLRGVFKKTLYIPLFLLLFIPIIFQFEIDTFTKVSLSEAGASPGLISFFHRVEYWQFFGADFDISHIKAWIGHGWGGFYDVVSTQFLSLDQISIYEGEEWSINANDSGLVTIHSHNIFIELLHGGGLVFYAIFCFSAIYFVRRLTVKHAWPVVVMCAFGSIWYLVPANVGAAVVALGALSSRRLVAVPRRVAAAACLLIAGLCVYAAVTHGLRAHMLDLSVREMLKGKDAAAPIDRLIEIDTAGDHFHELMVAGMTSATRPNLEALDNDPAIAWRNLERLWREARRRIGEGAALDRLVLYEVAARGHVLDPDSETYPPSEETAAWIREGWFDAAFAATAAAPGRQDLLVSPLADHVLRGQWDALARNAARIVARQPESPVGLWFLGLAEIQADETTARGFQRMARALDLGVGRFYPISEEVAAQVRHAAAAMRR